MPSVADFDDLVRAVLGDLVDAEEVAKMGPDPSSVHTSGQLIAVRAKRRKVTKKDLNQEPSEFKRNLALATNAGGVVAAPAAIGMAVRSARRNEGGMSREIGRKLAERKPGGRAARVVRALDSKTGRAGKIGAAVAGGSMVALQGLNAGGDYIAAGEMNRQRKVANQRKELASKGLLPLNQVRSGRLGSVMTSLGLGKKPPTPTPAAARVQPVNQAKGAAARQKVGDFAASTGGKVTLGAGAAYGVHSAGRNSGIRAAHEQAYYGKRDEVEISGEFSKFDEDKRRAYGWASVVTMDGEPVVDRQGDYIGLDDIEEAAYTYVRKSRVTGDMHRRTAGLDGADAPHKAGELIESVVFTPDKCHAMGLPASFAGRWWMGVQVEDDDVWQEVKKGNRTGFSIHGKGLRKDTTLDEIRSS